MRDVILYIALAVMTAAVWAALYYHRQAVLLRRGVQSLLEQVEREGRG